VTVYRSPKIVELDNDTWAMLYVPSDTDDVRFATSPKSDPHNWTDSLDNPIIVPNSGDFRGVGVVKDGSTFRILYDTLGQLCYAYGDDLTNLTKHSANDSPVFSGLGTGWEQWVRLPGLYKIGSTYHLFYDGRQDTATGEIGAIGHATSTDMINWIRDENNPIIEPGDYPFEASDVNSPELVVIDGSYYLFYGGYMGGGTPYYHDIGYAETDINLQTFTKQGVVLTRGPVGGWDNVAVQGPTFLQNETGTYLYYFGKDGPNGGIGYATLT